MAAERHRWRLVGPWYRPEPQPAPESPGFLPGLRGSRPVLQKYADPGFIAAFLDEPQRSLLWRHEDRVHKLATAVSKLGSLGNPRKLFLDIHSRHYLVVCELICDTPGLPAVNREQVCEAGFVLRRRRAQVQGPARQQLLAALRPMELARNELLRFDRLAAGRKRRQQHPSRPRAVAPAAQTVQRAVAEQNRQRRHTLERRYLQRKQRLDQLAAELGIALEPEGWLPGEHAGLGSWQPVDETPQQVEEVVSPLLPLVPDSSQDKHSAQGRSLYFGVIPTFSKDLDRDGQPRLDERSLYELRCFVRRQDRHRAAAADAGTCCGELVWSQPTEAFRLAPPADLDGTSHRPVTLMLPDLEALRAEAGSLALGEGAGLRMVAPERSALEFGVKEGKPAGARVGGAQICGFAIPLITIVASFVLRLFLPVVVFAFGLWFLLRLKFCIPPTVEVAADANLAADLAGSFGVDGQVSLDASIEGRIDGAIDALFGNPEDMTGESPPSDMKSLPLDDKGQLVADQLTDFSAEAPEELRPHLEPPPGHAIPRPLPAVEEGLAYYTVIPGPPRLSTLRPVAAGAHP